MDPMGIECTSKEHLWTLFSELRTVHIDVLAITLEGFRFCLDYVFHGIHVWYIFIYMYHEDQQRRYIYHT